MQISFIAVFTVSRNIYNKTNDHIEHTRLSLTIDYKLDLL